MRLLLSCTLAGLCLAAPAFAGSKPNPVSWGKIGVSFEQYRQDAVDCTREGYYLDVSGTEAAQTLKRASSQIENNEVNLYNPYGSSWPTQVDIVTRSDAIAQGTRPDKRFKEVRALQEDAVAKCLIERGYKRFTLTRDEQDHLAHLKAGSDARHQYLYSLAVNPKILSAQAVAGG
jgi:hypothetical protein